MRARSLALITVVAGVAAFAVATMMTECEDGTRNDARLFLDRFDGIDVDDPVEERRERIEGIARLPLGSVEIDAVRDACVEGHRALILAEDRTAEARVLLDRATAAEGLDTEIPTEVRASIESALSESSDALERANGLMTRCQEQVEALERRFD